MYYTGSGKANGNFLSKERPTDELILFAYMMINHNIQSKKAPLYIKVEVFGMLAENFDGFLLGAVGIGQVQFDLGHGIRYKISIDSVLDNDGANGSFCRDFYLDSFHCYLNLPWELY